MNQELLAESFICEEVKPSGRSPSFTPDAQLFLKIALVVAIPAAACLLAFLIVGSEWFRNHADPSWVQASDQTYQARNVRCDIVVYGDSTAITGVDPRIIQAATHLRTCNIAQTKASLVVSGTTALDIFLHNNPKPRILLLQFAGADLYKPQSWKDTTAYMEGVVSLLRFYPSQQLLVAVVRHPEILFGMMHYAYVTGPLNWWRNRDRAPSLHADDTPLDVHLTRPAPPYTRCEEVVDIDPIFHRPDIAYIRQLREHYSSMADDLLIEAAPTSDCDTRYDYLKRNITEVDNDFERYPVQLFNEGYSHFTSDGSARWSREIAVQLERRTLESRTAKLESGSATSALNKAR